MAEFVKIEKNLGLKGIRLGWAVRNHWSVENKNHHERDHHVWQEDRHRHRRDNIAMNLALTRNALLAIIGGGIAVVVFGFLGMAPEGAGIDQI